MSSWPPDSPLHDVDGPTTGARPNPGANAGSNSGATSLLPNPSMLRGLLLSYAPAALSPALVIETNQRLNVGIDDGTAEGVVGESGEDPLRAGGLLTSGRRPADEDLTPAGRIAPSRCVIRTGYRDFTDIDVRVVQRHFGEFQAGIVHADVQ